MATIHTGPADDHHVVHHDTDDSSSAAMVAVLIVAAVVIIGFLLFVMGAFPRAGAPAGGTIDVDVPDFRAPAVELPDNVNVNTAP